MSFPVDTGKPFRLGSWTVLSAENVLLGPDGARAHLEPRVMDLLCALARRAGEVVPRETLQAEVFGATHVEPGGLFKYVSQLRRSLGDAAKAPQFIETIPKRGYRLLVMPAPLPADAAPVPPVMIRWPTRPTTIGSALGVVAVVIVMMYFAMGATSNRGVAPPAAVEPSAGARIAFARARVFDETGSCAGYRRAIDEYRASLTQSPPYRVAFRSYADALVASAVLGCMPTTAAFASLDDFVRTAPPLTRTEHAYVGAARALFADRDLPRAGLLLGEAHGRATGRSADVTVAAYMAASGQLGSAIEEAQRALVRDPAAVGENWSVALGLYFAHRFDEAGAVLDAARELHPDSPFLRNLHLLVLLETKPAVAGERAQAGQASEFDRLSFADAYVLAKTGRRAAATRIAAQWEAEASTRWVPATSVAAIYLAIGDSASFRRWMRVAESEHDAWLVFRHVDPTLNAHD